MMANSSQPFGDQSSACILHGASIGAYSNRICRDVGFGGSRGSKF